MRSSWKLVVLLSLPAALALVACGDGDGPAEEDVPILDPEPAGAPTAMAVGSISCRGNAPPRPDGTNLTLPGWVRTYAEPDNREENPGAEVTAFDEEGTELGTAFSDTGNGRVAISVPVRETGFVGSARITSEGFVDSYFYLSRPAVNTDAAAWVWLVTPDERATLASEVGVDLEAGTGIIVGGVKDCDVFPVENAVVTVDGDAEGVVYFDGFDPDTDMTFSGTSSRFAVPNVAPGPVTVQAYARVEDGGALELLSRADIDVTADAITYVSLQPRVGVDR